MTEKKDEFIQVRVTKAEKATIKANASRFHLDMSIYLRDLGLEGVVPKWVRELQTGHPYETKAQSSGHGASSKEGATHTEGSRFPGLNRLLEGRQKHHRA